MKDTIGLINGKQTAITTDKVTKYPYARILIRRRHVYLSIDENLNFDIKDDTGATILNGLLCSDALQAIQDVIRGRMVDVFVSEATAEHAILILSEVFDIA